MASYETKDLAGASPLILAALRELPNWVTLATDDPRQFQGLAYYLVHNEKSPLAEQIIAELGPRSLRPRNPYVIEWKRPGGYWKTGLGGQFVRSKAGECYGRLRFRTRLAAGGAR